MWWRSKGSAGKRLANSYRFRQSWGAWADILKDAVWSLGWYVIVSICIKLPILFNNIFCRSSMVAGKRRNLSGFNSTPPTLYFPERLDYVDAAWLHPGIGREWPLKTSPRQCQSILFLSFLFIIKFNLRFCLIFLLIYY